MSVDLEEMEVEADALALEGLVTVSEDLEPYVLEWPDLHTMDGASEAFVLVVMKRRAGVLLAVPEGFIPASLLEKANRGEEAGPIGASSVFVVPGVLVEYGQQHPIGSSMRVVVVDMGVEVVRKIRVQSEEEEIAFKFDPENPLAIPSPTDLCRVALDWINEAGAETGLAFYSAGSQVEEEAIADGAATPSSVQATPVPRQRKPKPDTTSKEGRAKRPTTATLAASLDRLLDIVPALSNQVQSLAERQSQLEGKVIAQPKTSVHGLSQPLAASVASQVLPATAVAKVVAAPPPRTRASQPAGILQDPVFAQPSELLSLEAEKETQSTLSGDVLARAVLAQSQAVTALVGQIAGAAGDPLMDLGTAMGSSASTKGAQGRAKLQAELASHSGSYFLSVLRSMARRMQPTAQTSGTPLELLQRGVCGTLYMERFGGYGRQRELGLILYQIMGILDFLQAENIGAAKDSLALLAVAVDQAVLDGGRFDLASLLTLQEEPPSAIYVHRPQSAMARTKAFSPLADQKWVTVALAFIKEMDVIATKRTELAGGGAQPKGAGGGASDAAPKSKAAAKRKGKGGGGKHSGGSQNAAQEAEEEQ